MCANGGIKPDDLPPPSRNAYYFLKSIKLDAVPIVEDGKAERPVRVRLKNVVAVADRFSRRMWRGVDDLLSDKSALSSLRFGIETAVDGIELVCKDQGGDPSMMPLPSRQSFAWMKFLLAENNLVAHLEALKMGRYIALERGLSVEIHLANMRALWNICEQRGTILIKLHEGFILADDNVWSNVMQPLDDRSPESNEILQSFAAEQRFRHIAHTLDSLA
ncbi:MAG TPA: hypothetical protein V6D17_13220 [Candidatus Obscuribacterales bacterium]